MKGFRRLFVPALLSLIIGLSGCSSGGYWGVSGDVPGTGTSYYMGDGYHGHHYSKKHYKKMRKERKKREKERRKAYKKAQKRAKKYYKKHHRHHDD